VDIWIRLLACVHSSPAVWTKDLSFDTCFRNIDPFGDPRYLPSTSPHSIRCAWNSRIWNQKNTFTTKKSLKFCFVQRFRPVDKEWTTRYITRSISTKCDPNHKTNTMRCLALLLAVYTIVATDAFQTAALPLRSMCAHPSTKYLCITLICRKRPNDVSSSCNMDSCRKSS